MGEELLMVESVRTQRDQMGVCGVESSGARG